MRKVKPKTARKKFRLEEHLILAPYIAEKLGLKKVSDIKTLKDVQEGFDSTGRSYLYHRLVSSGSLKITEDALCHYDDNIRAYMERLAKARGKTIQLRYFQHLALLFMEIYLDEFFRNPVELTNNLFAFQQKNDLMPKKPFGKGDLRKLAMWMATGSGKTLLMHINLWQIQKYNCGPNALAFNNIILVTPNEALSDQHIEELRLSGILAKKFRRESGGYFFTDESNVVKVIEITKLKLPEDKKGEGETIDVTEFGDRNLVLVDEGHKGQQSEERKWMRVREELAKKGFTLEYSATFGQVIKDGKGGEPSNELVAYSKAILFDYSYKYFYSDGYGKDFRLLNLKDDHDNHMETIMLANAVSFYEQLRVYQEFRAETKEYNIEQPLWIFLGHKVQEDESDILVVLRFFSKLIENKGGWVNHTVEELLAGKSGMVIDDKDIFAKRNPETVFPYLRKKGISADEIVKGILHDVFAIKPGVGRKLHLVDIKRAEGELGLKASASQEYFGVINIGDKNKFRNYVEKEEPGIAVENDAFSDSLFQAIELKGTRLNVLIGAKKFIEGWNCWRVSTMGLLNVGKGEGPQIIQLFGRGVRLKGKGFTLKRSKALNDAVHQPFIEVLETLGIFGIKANYLTAFKEMLELEEVKSYETISLPIIKNSEMLKGLKILRLKKNKDFKKDCFFSLSDVLDVRASLNILPKVDLLDSRKEMSIVNTTNEPTPRRIPEYFSELLDWSIIYLEMLAYRAEKNLYNISFTYDDLKQVIKDGKYELKAPESFINPREFQDLGQLEQIVIRLLKNYLDKCYSRKRNEWEKCNLELVQVTEDNANFPQEYIVKIEESATKLIKEARTRIESKLVYSDRSNTDPLPNIFYENHLYQPLLAKTQSDQVIFHHTGLNESEQRFVSDLAKCVIEQSEDIRMSTKYFLLRNLTRGKGISFFETSLFYPDFILWIKRGDHQWMVFIEPHGMIYSAGLDDEKANLYSYLDSNIKPQFEDSDVTLDAYVISATDFAQFRTRHGTKLLSIEQCAEKHILFMDKSESHPNPDYVNNLLGMAMKHI